MEINHHGYLLTGDMEKAEKAAFEMAAKILSTDEDKLRAHPDFSFLDPSADGNSFTIDDARSIRERSSKKSFSGKGRVFVIKSNVFTREASNALLKTMEEPAGLSYFFVVTFSPENVLNTLRSRLVPITFYPGTELPKEQVEFVKNFLNASVDKRIEWTKELAEDKQKTLDFLNGLELFFREKLIKNFSGEIINSIDDIGHQRDFLRGRSSSPKMILEHLGLTLPRL